MFARFLFIVAKNLKTCFQAQSGLQTIISYEVTPLDISLPAAWRGRVDEM